MPDSIIFDITKSNFDEILKKETRKDEKENSSIKIILPVEIVFTSLEELKILQKFLQEDKKLEYLKINLPGSFSFVELLTEDLLKEQVPNLKITIQEKVDGVATTSFNEFF